MTEGRWDTATVAAGSSLEDHLTPNGLAVLKRRYVRRGSDGEATEGVEDVFWRVARHIAAAERGRGEDIEAVARRFFGLMASLRFMPNSPTFTGAGTPLGQLAACFVLPISDDMGRAPDGIFQTLRNAALIQQTGGGNGFSFSSLRPKGAVVRSSGGQATGPVGFMRVFDVASEIISQGGARRGANMAVLRVDHPDIEAFITCKTDEHAITNFNISVGVTDAFMEAVVEDGTIDLVNPQDGQTWRTVSARELFERIVAGAYRNGEPGMLFLDAANRDNPCPHLGAYEATNPCGEQFLLPYENCCLASVNLARHMGADHEGRAAMDWHMLQETVSWGVRFLDDVVDANAYVPAVPELERAALRTRRIGLGIMGLGDVMYCLGVRYGSERAQELAAQLMEFVRYHAMMSSVRLAQERGPFPAIAGSMYDPDDLRWQPPGPLRPYRCPEEWGRPALDWRGVVEAIRRHGIRNAAQTTIAPTGTVGTVAGCEAYGCEPVFALAYVRLVNDGGEDLELEYVSPLFQRALDREDLDEETKARILRQVMQTGSCQDVEELPQALRDVFVVAGDIPAEEHVRMQAVLQAFVDSSISKTINFPGTAGPDEVARAFRLAWRWGCKGLTVYVSGSRERAVLETEQVRRARAVEGPSGPSVARRPRPHVLDGRTYRLSTPLGTAYITVNRNGEGEPFEVFLNVGKAGSDTAAVAEAIGRLISLALRIPSSLSPTQRMKYVVDQLEGIGGGRPLGFGRDRVRSLPDGVAQVLAEYLGLMGAAGREEMGHRSAVPSGDLCPECGHASLVNEEGCRRCYSCGYTEC
jgi:ribonucleoside-diphosphate reductase alpha chain